MKATFSNVLNALFGLSLKTERVETEHHNRQITYDPNIVNTIRYWLDCELFDLPAIAKNSQTPENFKRFWQAQNVAIQQGKLKLTDDSRGFFMFQCHYAGYVFDPHDMPNTQLPKSYLASIGLKPVWNTESNQILWELPSDFDKETIYNLAAMRTLYRGKRPSSANHQKLEEWVSARLEFLNDFFEESFSSEGGISTASLLGILVQTNRKLANEFWTDEGSRDYIQKNALPVDGKYDAEYRPHTHANGQITFRWRHSFQPDGLDNIQIGPFFVKDLEHILSQHQSQGWEGLSRPLLLYLNGYENFYNAQQSAIPINPAKDDGFYLSKFRSAPISAWPSDPRHGLSFLQAFVVSHSIAHGENNHLIPVNGPPGTGKTTLLKDVIAHRFVERTRDIYEAFKKDDNWFQKESSLAIIMDASIVVASSNNKAVENISEELPDLKSIFSEYRDSTRHFREVSDEGTWGLFCAVLGNKGNRNRFTNKLTTLSKYLKKPNDIFEIDKLKISLNEVSEEGRGRKIYAHLSKLAKAGELLEFKNAITKTHIYKKQRLNWLFEVIELVENACESRQVIDKLKTLTKDEWSECFESIDKLGRQWFAAKLGEKILEERLYIAKTDFEALLEKSEGFQKEYAPGGGSGFSVLSVCFGSNCDTDEDLTKLIYTSQAFCNFDEENETKAALFSAACRLNEAMLLKAGASIQDNLNLVKSVMAGDTDDMKDEDISKAWATLFLFFPVVSSSLASVEAQFSTLKHKGAIGLSMVDEAGQAINYHVAGLLQRSKQAMLVGDPIQVEPVVSTPIKADLRVAREFMHPAWVEKFAVTCSSAQTLADQAGSYVSFIGDRKVGMPLLVHRRCSEPMFSISNEMAYDNKMINAKEPEHTGSSNYWIDTYEDMRDGSASIDGYKNHLEAETAMNLLELIVKAYPEAIKDGVFIITPFKDMEYMLKKAWVDRFKMREHIGWMVNLLSEEVRLKSESDPSSGLLNDAIKDYANANIGTVHTFQGKEASTVIVCMGATRKAGKGGGVSWVNEKPNILNVAVTRAKANLHIIGCANDWNKAEFSKITFKHGMQPVKSLAQLIANVSRNHNVVHTIQRQQKLCEPAVDDKLDFF